MKFKVETAGSVPLVVEAERYYEVAMRYPASQITIAHIDAQADIIIRSTPTVTERDYAHGQSMRLSGIKEAAELVRSWPASSKTQKKLVTDIVTELESLIKEIKESLP